jgi:acyl-CoA reductase-like NAD-dependent aldehyde dehydrogenase
MTSATLESSFSVPGARNPATGAQLSPVTFSTQADVKEAVHRAREAQPAWGALPLAQREEKAMLLARRILERRDEIKAILSSETGRDPTECLVSEVMTALSFAKAAVRAARQALQPDKVRLSPLEFPGKKIVVEAVPRGVVGIIAPWNYPLGNFMKSLFPALLAGNSVVLKPSEHTPRSGIWLATVAREVFAPGVVEVVSGAGDVGAWLISGGLDAVVFTGSVGTGRKVCVEAALQLLPCSVELGGKDAAIVLADCEFDRTVAGITHWAIHNAGQNCAAIERVYVEDALADRFVERLGKVVGALRVAPQKGGHADLGPMQNQAQLTVVEAHVQDALAKGARLVTGGKRTGEGLGYLPTVLDACNESMRVVTEETFGPVIAVIRVKDAEEAVKRANDSRYGLNGSVWTSNLQRGTDLARRLEVGVALVNNHALTGVMPETPWTGTRDTGPGVANSKYAYHTFVRRRTLLVDSNRDPDPFWMPSNDDLASFAEAVANMGLGSLGATFSLLGLVKKRIRAIKEAVSRHT